MALRPLNVHILAQRIEEETVSKGGIIIPDAAKEKPARARVVAVGSGKLNKNGTRQPIDIKKDELVLFGKYAGTEVKLGLVDYIILREDDILAVIEDDK
ncbi:MAG: co-chaperone GroES [Bradymonadales bacterium]|jgi:chaperonin GroES